MLHDDKKLSEISKAASNYYCMTCREPDVDEVAKKYAEHQAAPLEARILALEKALKDSHHYHVINARRYDATNSPLEFNEAMGIVHAPVEPHPLLVDRNESSLGNS